MNAPKAPSRARRRRPKRRGGDARTAEFRLPKREEARLERQLQYLDDEGRAALHASLERGLADLEAGRVVDHARIKEVLRATRARP
jgi:hypothetical protein